MSIDLVPSAVQPSPIRVAVTGLSYRKAKLELRELFAVPEERLGDTLRLFLEVPKVDEAVLVSTCNRVEVITAGAGAGSGEIAEVFRRLPREDREIDLYHFDQIDAVRHLFKVTSGLDSMVLGEPQILGQVKRAYEFAHANGATKAVLNHLFQFAFGVAKEVRTRTNIGKNAVSVCFAARELAKQIVGDLSDASVLVIGAGEVGELLLKHLVSGGVKRVFLANRSFERAHLIGAQYTALPIELAQAHSVLGDVDIVVGCTPALDESVLSLEHVMCSSRRPQFFIDLGVPRTFNQAIGDLAEVFLYNVDDLEKVVRQNIDSRRAEAAEAEVIVDEEVNKFLDWLSRRVVEARLGAVMQEIGAQQGEEIQKTMKRLKRSGIEESELLPALNDLCHSVASKVLHQPLAACRKANDLELIELLFGKKKR